jgi:hypothetical protein
MSNLITVTGNGHVSKRRPRKPKLKANVGSLTAQWFNFTAENLLEPTAVATFITKSSDGHRQHQKVEEVVAPAPSASSSVLDPIDLDAGQVHDDPPLPFIDLLEKEIANEAATKTRARRYVSSVSIWLIRLL